MGKAVVIGATGHIGSWLTPALAAEGYEVIAYSRRGGSSYTDDRPEWKQVEKRKADRSEAIREAAGMDDLDVICDLLPFTVEDAKELVDAVYAGGRHKSTRLISIGSIWIYSEKYCVPVTEEHPRTGADEYGRNKALIEAYLMNEYREHALPVTILHPGHICGPGWIPVGPTGNLDPQVIRTIRSGGRILLPELGQATLHHVHAEDIARLAVACLHNDASIGEMFHITCPQAITLTGFAKMLYRHYGTEPDIRYVPFREFLDSMTPEYAAESAEHIDRSPACSMEKAKRILGYSPLHTEEDTLLESLDSLDIC